MIYRNTALAAGTAILTILSACATVGPNYVKPAPLPPQAKATIPLSYKEVDGWRLAHPKDNVLRGTWWEIYAIPELNALEEQVAVANQNVAQAEANYRQAQALVRASRSGFYPVVTGGASVTRSRRSAGVIGRVIGGQIFNDFLLPINFSWEIDLWGRVRRTVEAGMAGAQASQADLASVLLSAQALLAQDYFQLRTIDAQKKVLEDTIGGYQKSLDLTKNRYAAGVASRADVLQAETQLSTAQAQSIDLGVQRAQLSHAMALLVGKPPSAFSISVAPLVSTPPAVPIGVPSDLLERRPDIATAERSVAAANARIGVAEAAFYPNVNLSASAGLEAASLAKWLTWPARFWSVGPAVSEILFNGGLRQAQTEQARAAYDAEVAAYRQTVLTGFQEVEDSLVALHVLEEEARVQQEALTAARQTVEVVTNQYKAGTVSYLNVIVAQTTALSNEQTALNILGRRMAASVTLVKALGGGWDASALR
ncbi:efflux transporter outer membrane subunit [Candidatus Deferrimicrobium sp.]|uniref:efflux transporter outer membrane subunit n=1 Tax=Candidatus Deferrimicrobium sp. TaxID=3060586 RepID=UPI002ED6B781